LITLRIFTLGGWFSGVVLIIFAFWGRAIELKEEITTN
jgi:hypothetical protein